VTGVAKAASAPGTSQSIRVLISISNYLNPEMGLNGACCGALLGAAPGPSCCMALLTKPQGL